MKIKHGANIQGLDIRMRPLLIAADDIWKEYGKELVITCGLNGTHSAGSLHYYGRAVDLRTRYFDGVIQHRIAAQLSRRVGDEYDVVVHRTHIHGEYDPREDTE